GGGASAWAQGVSVPESRLPGLERLIAVALEQSPQVILRNAQSAIADADLIVAKSARLPSVSADGRFLQAREKRGDFATATDAEKIYYELSLSQSLYQWGNVRRGIENAELRVVMDARLTRD